MIKLPDRLTAKTADGILTSSKEVEYFNGDGQNRPNTVAEALDNVVGSIDDKDNAKNITYSELKSLRDNSQLIPGTFYRITDYVTTTVQSNTQSAGHQFDVIVRADEVNVLNENAYATRHAGDTYFANSKLEAWELKYCLDNDTNRFVWADSTNGKGVIYYMKDEWGNECPYDFKNITYSRFKITSYTKNPGLVGTYGGFYGLDSQGGQGSIFPLYATMDISDVVNRYTFGFKGRDSSLGGSSRCEENVILPHYVRVNSIEKQCLNNITFSNTNSSEICKSNKFGSFCNSMSFGNSGSFNLFGNSCYNNSFGNDCQSNLFGNGFYNNAFGNGCYYNSFGGDCYNNSFGGTCQFNSFGSFCYSNSFKNNCQFNSFGNECYSNSFGSDCQFNSFGNFCRLNGVGDSCTSNSFGDGCNSNSFHSYCSYNSFGNNCSSNFFMDFCSSNLFGNDCVSNSFQNFCSYNSFGNSCYYNFFNKFYIQYVIIENGNQYITLTSTQTTSDGNYIRNIKITQGVNNSDSRLTISHDTVNDKYQTVYRAQESQDVYLNSQGYY